MTEIHRPSREARLKRVRRMKRARRARKFGVWSLVGMSVFGVLLGLAVLLLLEQTLRAPQWLRDRVETRIEAGLGGLQIDFGDVELVIGEGWRPRAALRDVRLADADGRALLSLSDAEASLAMRPLLRGEVQPKTITLRGAFAQLRRARDGSFSLAFDGSTAPVEEARGLVLLIQQLDALVLRPELTALQLVDLDQINLRYEDAVSGRAWTVDGGTFRVSQNDGFLRASGNLAVLSGRDFASSIEVNYTSQIGVSSAEFGLSLTDVPARDIAGQSVALSWLNPLRARLSGALRGSVDETGAFGPLNATLQIGAGVLQPNDAIRPVPFQSAQAYFTYEPAEQAIRFDEISVVSDWVTGSATGTTWLSGIETGRLSDLIGQMSLTTTRLNPDGLYPEPIVLNEASADVRIGFDPFTLTLGQVFVEDGGSRMHLSGDLAATPAGWDLALDADVNALTPERLVALWPENALPKARSWIDRNLQGGRLSDVNLALRVSEGDKPNVYLDFDFDDTNIAFMRTMPPIAGASGQATLINNRFVATATAGTIAADQGGAVDVTGTSFIIPDTSIRKAAPAIVRARGAGTITAVLSLLNREPLRLMDKPGLPVALADGTTTFHGNIALPLKERVDIEEVSFVVDGLARDVATAQLVPGQVLQAADLAIRASSDAIEILGDGLIGAIPFQAKWAQVLGQPGAGSRVEGTLRLSPETLETFQIALPPGSVAGEGEGRFSLDLQPGEPPQLDLRSDLTGLRLSLPELGWTKPASQSGTLSLSATLQTPARVEALELAVPGLTAVGTVQVAEGGGLERAEFSSVKRADWLDVSARLEGRGPGRTPAVRILDGTLDLRRAEFGRSPAGTTPQTEGGVRDDDALVASLDRLQVTDTIALTGFEGRFAVADGLSGDFEGQINDQTRVVGRVVPEAGRSAVRVQSNDAGGVFRAAGILRQAREGAFDMTLRPVGEPGNFDGSITVTNTFVRDAPAMAALLNAISIVGLLSELSGQGIFFSDVAARFRLSPSQITLYESRATGPSLGLSMDGRYDVPNQRLAMQGVISPVYLLNQIGGLFSPRRGEGLFGFNYALSGPVQSPQVQVNPLSALTPGVLRDIFREPAPQPDTPEQRQGPASGSVNSAEDR